MFEIQHSEITTSTKETIWQLWSNVAAWPKWDSEIEYASLNGDFTVGTTGVLKPKGGPKSKFTIIECQPYQRFADVTPLPLTKLYFTHEMTDTPEGLRVTHTVKMTGPLTFLFSKIIGKNLQKGLPGAVKNLVKMAENRG